MNENHGEFHVEDGLLMIFFMVMPALIGGFGKQKIEHLKNNLIKEDKSFMDLTTKDR